MVDGRELGCVVPGKRHEQFGANGVLLVRHGRRPTGAPDLDRADAVLCHQRAILADLAEGTRQPRQPAGEFGDASPVGMGHVVWNGEPQLPRHLVANGVDRLTEFLGRAGSAGKRQDLIGLAYAGKVGTDAGDGLAPIVEAVSGGDFDCGLHAGTRHQRRIAEPLDQILKGVIERLEPRREESEDWLQLERKCRVDHVLARRSEMNKIRGLAFGGASDLFDEIRHDDTVPQGCLRQSVEMRREALNSRGNRVGVVSFDHAGLGLSCRKCRLEGQHCRDIGGRRQVFGDFFIAEQPVQIGEPGQCHGVTPAPGQSRCPVRRRCTWLRAHSAHLRATVPAPPSRRYGRPTCRADGQGQSRRHCG